jgi:predicted MPP superfamily phosphohydrolase
MFVGRDRLDEALADVPPNALKLLLTHTVEDPEQLAARGFDAVFAGHSHGGQVRLPFLGPIITRSSLPRKFASGVFEAGGTQFHLNNGIGAGRWTPFRFRCPPEATVIELAGQQPGKSK